MGRAEDKGDKCRSCGGEITYTGKYWEHVGKTPRYRAVPMDINKNKFAESEGSEIKHVLHILRNPYGHSPVEIRIMQLKACDLIEQYRDAYKNMRDFAESKGLDVITHG